MPLLIAALLQAAPAVHEPIPELEARVVAVAGAGVGQPGGPAQPLDRRLRLRPCPLPATITTGPVGALTVACPAHGWRLHVPLVGGGGGEPGGAAAMGGIAVRRGDAVTVRFTGTGFALSWRATADQDGRIGERIRVRSAARAQPQWVELTAPGEARIPE